MANYTEGWIKLHRSMLESAVASEPEHLALWVTLMLMASHTERDVIVNGVKLRLRPGQLITSRLKMAARSGIQESKVERILNFLKIEQQIEQQNLTSCRLISIINWHDYQASEQEIERGVNSERTATEQRVNTYRECKEFKNEKNVRKEESCVEVADRDSPPPQEDLPVLVFPAVGCPEKSWTLTESKFSEYQQTYSTVDVAAELRKARQWCVDNPSNRKTRKGMPAFLNRWLNKAQERGKSNGNSGDSSHLTFAQMAMRNTVAAVQKFGSERDD